MGTRRLRIAYLVEDTVLCGGNRVILGQADALIDRGHEVVCVTRGGPFDWRASKARWIHVRNFSDYDASADDAVIGTFFRTLSSALELGGDRAVHLCQGYEGFISHYAPILGEIEAAYSLPLPKLVVSPHLAEVCRRFNDDVVNIGQIIDDSFFRAALPPENDPLRVILAGESIVDLRGVNEGYEAVRRARAAGLRFSLVRVSTLDPPKDEPVSLADEFHVRIHTDAMTRLVHSCDVAIAPNHFAEGFGLPAAEALASGLAVVMTRIPSYLSFDEVHDYAAFVGPADPDELTAGLISVLGDATMRDRLRDRGRKVAGKFRAPAVAEKIERYLLQRRTA